MRYLLMAVMVMAAATVEARLGETQEQIVARFDPPAHKDGNRWYFIGKGLVVIVEFVDGRSGAEFYALPPEKGGVYRDMPWENILDLMSKNAGGSSWKETIKHNGNRQWVRENRTAVCSYDETKHVLSFTTREWANRVSPAPAPKN